MRVKQTIAFFRKAGRLAFWKGDVNNFNGIELNSVWLSPVRGTGVFLVLQMGAQHFLGLLSSYAMGPDLGGRVVVAF